MTPDQIPQDLVDILDARAGKAHSRTGPVLAALAEILTYYDRADTQLQAELDESQALCGRMAELLTGVANALKGDPGPLKLHDWSDLPAVAKKVAAAAAESPQEQEQYKP